MNADTTVRINTSKRYSDEDFANWTTNALILVIEKVNVLLGVFGGPPLNDESDLGTIKWSACSLADVCAQRWKTRACH